MMNSARRTILALGVTLLALTLITTSVMAAGPRIMIVYGQPLAKPVVFSNWGENEGLMIATNDEMSVQHARLIGRPFLRVAMFWGSGWVQYMKEHRTVNAIRPSQANQWARFYPAYGTTPPLFVLDSIPGPYKSLVRRVSPTGIAILAHHGIPIRLPVRTRTRGRISL